MDCSRNDPPSEIIDDEDYLIEVIPVGADESDDEENARSDTEEANHWPASNENDDDYDKLNDGMEFECVRNLKKSFCNLCFIKYTFVSLYFFLSFIQEDYKFSIDDAAATAAANTTSTADKIDDRNEENSSDCSLEREENESEKEEEKKKQTRYACDRCDKSFVHLSSLAKHKRIIHQGIRPYACDQCSLRCISAIDLKRHSVSHTDERPYSCDQCDKSFKQESSLTEHKKVVHQGIQKIARFACESCDKCFVTSTALKFHMYTHSGKKMVTIFYNSSDKNIVY